MSVGTDRTVIDLDTVLARVAARAKLFGVERDILPLDTAGYQSWEAMVQGKAYDPAIAIGIVARHVPSLTSDEVGRLTPEVMGQIIGYASRGIAEVAATAPKAEGTSRGRASSRRTRSGPSVSASRSPRAGASGT